MIRCRHQLGRMRKVLAAWLLPAAGMLTAGALEQTARGQELEVGIADVPGPVAVTAPKRQPHPLLSPRHVGQEISLQFRDAPLEQLTSLYSDLTDRLVIEAPNLRASISLRSAGRILADEALDAIESALALHGIAIIPVGERFLKLVPLPTAGQEGLPAMPTSPEQWPAESDRAETRIFVLRHLDLAEAQPIVQGLLRTTARIQPLERVNGLLVTDTALNLRRVAELLQQLDQPTEARVETRVYELTYAKARDVAARLQELVQETARPRPAAVAPQPAASAAPVPPQTPPGVIRAPPRTTTTPTAADAGERGLLQGRLKIVADERSNLLIVVALPENFAFIDRIVAVLDRRVDPALSIRVRPLEYAKAEEVANLLGNLLGGSKSEQAPAARSAPPSGARGRTLEEATAPPAEAQVAPTAREGEPLAAWSGNTRVLADKRTNTLLLMGPRVEVDALEDVIRLLDIATTQVLIEAVIIEVRLTKGLEYGIEWLQRALSVYNPQSAGPMGGVTVVDPVLSFGGGQRFTETPFRDAATVARNDPALTPGGLTYYTTIYGLNLDLILRAVGSSSDARVLSTPVIQTTDNTEAKIVVGEERPVVTSTSVSTGGQQTSTYQYRNIGLELSVTPRINPEGVVVMEVVQTADNLGGFEVIDGNRVPVITKREVRSSIIAPHRATIALGGLVNNDRRLTRAKIPLLGDLPVVGWLFRSERWEDNRTELLVLLTPYVLVTPEQARNEARRLYQSGRLARAGLETGWSVSELAEPPKQHGVPPLRILRRREADPAPVQTPEAAGGETGPSETTAPRSEIRQGGAALSPREP